MAIRLRVRKTPDSNWIENFSRGGWAVKATDGRWVYLNPQNTKVRSADGTQWLPVK